MDFDGLRADARHIYGADPMAYDQGRPDYPPVIYERLTGRCGLSTGTRVLEIGPGNGVVTRHLLAAGATVTATEPDPGFVAHLRGAHPAVSVMPTSFEDADVAGEVDLIVAATSFHWLEQAAALGKVRTLLRPGGWLALWWTVFSDPTRPDPVIEEATAILGFEPGNQRRGTRWQLDERARIDDLERLAGLTDVQAESVGWDLPMTAAEVRDLFATQIGVRRLPADERDRALDVLADRVAAQPAGVDHRPLLTVLYTGRRP